MADLKEEIGFFDKIREEPEFERFDDRPIAYFCAEFDLDNVGQRVYSGGLGVLAGDIVREAGDRNLPMIAVGLYYNEGYVCATKRVGDQNQEVCEPIHPRDAGLEAVRMEDGERLYVDVPIHDRIIKCRVWKVKEAPIDVYLIDTNSEHNSPQDRHITDRLYVADKETRLKQEIVLGIGGMRALGAMGIHPGLFHLNEGHSALLALELIQHEMKERHIGFDEAKQYARRRIVMTNHTLVPAGQEIFSYDLTAMLLERYAEELSVPCHKLVELGRVQEASEFSMSMLAFRTASVINAVSNLHAAEAKKIWQNHPMVPITNGVHVGKWDQVGDENAEPKKFWAKHQERKQALTKYLQESCGKDWDPDTLIVGWARRIVKYKRPLAAFFDLHRLGELARNSERPMKIVYAGHPHPSDDIGRELLDQIMTHAEGDLKDVVALLPGYDTDVAKLLISGCDIWLNTPVVGFEACGTSGMKAALNGVLPLSTNDGWIAEADIQRIGWLMHNDHVSDDFYERLEQDILPLYYTRDEAGYPELWEGNMRRCRAMIKHQFTATRMMREYWEMLYL
jgi:glucan phosphorylase